MPANQSEWLIHPSRTQQCMDTACWLLGAIMLTIAMDGCWTLLSVVPLIGAMVEWRTQRAPTLMGKSKDGWWLYADDEKRPVTFKGGSVRRRQYVRLVWGFWPWQVLFIRPDSFLDAEPYRHLKYELYGSV